MFESRDQVSGAFPCDDCNGDNLTQKCGSNFKFQPRELQNVNVEQRSLQNFARIAGTGFWSPANKNDRNEA